MIDIRYVIGDVREPIINDKNLIIHCCNDQGRMGSGVALAILNKWPRVREHYVRWFKNNSTMVIKNLDGSIPDGSFKLGNIQFVRVEIGKTIVINMIAQHDTVEIDGVAPIRYDAMRECLKKVYNMAVSANAIVNMPYLMGCDRAGGDWNIVEKMIAEELCEKDISVIIYDIDNRRGT
jgi:O-acetyl-ADP-ribose deacetylase (regulator of RNase III)